MKQRGERGGGEGRPRVAPILGVTTAGGERGVLGLGVTCQKHRLDHPACERGRRLGIKSLQVIERRSDMKFGGLFEQSIEKTVARLAARQHHAGHVVGFHKLVVAVQQWHPVDLHGEGWRSMPPGQ
jgi:hypothetical protein